MPIEDAIPTNAPTENKADELDPFISEASRGASQRIFNGDTPYPPVPVNEVLDGPKEKIVPKNQLTKSEVVKRISVGALGVATAATLGAGLAHTLGPDPSAAVSEYADEKDKANTLQNTMLDTNLEGTFSTSDVLGEITIPENGGVLAPAEAFLGDNVTSDNFDVLQRSAVNQGTVQPGQKFTVVKADVDGNAENGKEFIVVDQTQINHGKITELPPVDTH